MHICAVQEQASRGHEAIFIKWTCAKINLGKKKEKSIFVHTSAKSDSLNCSNGEKYINKCSQKE